MNEKNFEILWTKVDEAPYLATFAFLPPVRKILEKANININIKDISLSARVLAQFQDYLREDQRVSDYLAELGELVLKDPSIDLVKLPNISATIPQLTDTINELKKKGYNIPDYPDESTIMEQVKKYKNHIAIDADKIATEVGSKRASNIVMLGAASPFFKLPPESFEEGIRKIFGRKGDKIVEMNINAFRAGRDFANKNK